MAEGIKQTPCEIVLASGEDDGEVFSFASVSDDCEDFMFSEEEDEISFSSFSSNSSSGPLYELSSLMEDLPIKRGLSKFFHGKSQSFTSLSEVKCIEDLAKKERPYNKRMKSYRRNEKSSMNQKPYFAPNHSSRIISKNVPSISYGSVLGRSRSSSLFYSNKASSISMQKNYKSLVVDQSFNRVEHVQLH